MSFDSVKLEPTSARCTDDSLVILLASGVTVSAPLERYAKLAGADHAARNNIELSPFGLHWPDLDEDLSIEGILLGKGPTRTLR